MTTHRRLAQKLGLLAVKHASAQTVTEGARLRLRAELALAAVPQSAHFEAVQAAKEYVGSQPWGRTKKEPVSLGEMEMVRDAQRMLDTLFAMSEHGHLPPPLPRDHARIKESLVALAEKNALRVGDDENTRHNRFLKPASLHLSPLHPRTQRGLIEEVKERIDQKVLQKKPPYDALPPAEATQLAKAAQGLLETLYKHLNEPRDWGVDFQRVAPQEKGAGADRGQHK